MYLAGNTTGGWTWRFPVGAPGETRCLGVSFFPDSGQMSLTVISLGYERDSQNNTVLHFTLRTGGNGGYFRAAATRAPSW